VISNHPEITFTGNQVEVKGEHDYAVTGDMTIRGVTRKGTLNVSYLGQWETPWWEDGVDKGPRTRAGFLATGQINRQDFGVSWQDTMDRGGIESVMKSILRSILKRYLKRLDAVSPVPACL